MGDLHLRQMLDYVCPDDTHRQRLIYLIWMGHYNIVIMGAIASQITNLLIVYSTVFPGADQRKPQSSASLAFVRGIHRWPLVRDMQLGVPAFVKLVHCRYQQMII